MQIEEVELISSLRIGSKDSLIIIDVQNDFLPGGMLAVTNGDKIIEGINKLGTKFHKNQPIVLTQDWHPPDHQSFASAHSGKKPYESYQAPGIGPILWPDHCIQGSPGAEFSPLLNSNMGTLIIRKGFHKTIDSYSAFLENDKKTETGLHAFLQGLKIERLFLTGLALDYCVYFSAIDARKYNFEVIVVLDLTKPVNSPEDSMSNALQSMNNKGVLFINSDQINLG